MKKLYTLFAIISFSLAAGAQTNLVNDPSFELGPGNGAWTEFSTNFATPYCDQASCGNCGGGCIARTGTWYTWYGGTTALEIGILDQNITIPVSTAAELKFWITIPTSAGNSADFLAVVIDNVDTVFNVTGVDTIPFNTGYIEMWIPMTAYANGASHNLKFYSQTDLAVTNFIVDDVDLRITTNAGVISYLLLDGVSFFPNPATDKLHLNFAGDPKGAVNVEGFDMLGNKVLSLTYDNVMQRHISVDVSDLAAGAYMFKVMNGEHMVTNRIVVD